jgi:Uma2 family endonuclease
VEEYYALDKASDRRWEYWDGEIVCMSGGSKEHAIIQGNVLKHVSNRLKEHCRAFSADLAVKVNNQAGYVYPDLSVACAPKYEKHSQGIDLLTNPLLIVEVTSPTSGIRDHNVKKRAYQGLESLSDYLVIEPEGPYITHYVRGPKQWRKRIYNESEDQIEIASLGITLTVAEIYQGLEIS